MGEALTEEPPRRKIKWTAAELMATTFPEPRWAVPEIVAEGVTVLAGAPKVGKSWLALALAVAVAADAGIALGKVPVVTGDVLYLALEDNARRLRARLGKVLAGQSATDRLTLVTECEALPAGGAERISEWLTMHPDARLVVVDVFARVRGAVPQNLSSYDADYMEMSRLKTLADRHKVAVLVVHHTRKTAAEDFLETVSGTNGIAGAADAVLVLTRSRGEADGILNVTGRDVPELAHPLRFDADLGMWQLLDGPAADYSLTDESREIVRYLREHGSATPKQLAEHFAVKDGTMRQRCTRMASRGELDTDGHGSYFLRPDTPVAPVTHVTDGVTGATGVTPLHPPSEKL